MTKKVFAQARNDIPPCVIARTASRRRSRTKQSPGLPRSSLRSSLAMTFSGVIARSGATKQSQRFVSFLSENGIATLALRLARNDKKGLGSLAMTRKSWPTFTKNDLQWQLDCFAALAMTRKGSARSQ